MIAATAAVPVLHAESESTSPALCGGGPLEILLTNDDGFEAPGIRALYDALRKAGHHVRIAAPAKNASGSSSSFTWTSVKVVRDAADPDVVGVEATPATAVVLGATALYPPGRRPDLVVSGINDGENVGFLLALSGTIGAALAGTMLLDAPVPGIAVNAERASTDAARLSLPPDQLQRVAGHAAKLVNSARSWFCDGDRLARPTTVLNVNYPALPMSAIRGVAVARQGRTSDLHVTFERSGADAYASQRVDSAPEADYPDSDTTLLRQGYVTVTPISAVLDERDVPLRELERRLDALKP
jgi:5'-nucleotidase